MSCCCGGGTTYNPETTSDCILVNVNVPTGCKPGQKIEVIAPDGTGRSTIVSIPPECNFEGSSFMVRFTKQHNSSVNTNVQANSNSNAGTVPNENTTSSPAAAVIPSNQEMKICVQVPMGARVGSMMYAPVPGDASRVLPIKVPSRKVRKFYVDYTMDQTILRSDVPGGDGKKQNWHDNRLAVAAPLFF